MEISKVTEKYDNYLDENELYSNEQKIKKLKSLLELNDCLYDAYVDLMNIYYKEERFQDAYMIIKEGYETLLKKEFNNRFNLLLTLNYQELSSRAKYRVIYNYADALWIFENKRESLKIFKKMLRMNPNDNIGARYAICGILENYNCSNHIWNEHNQNIEQWFKEKMKKHVYLKGFGWMRTYLK